jgi:class III poly(R)-hydroxyalkanoic acid synthase PhaE subunit
MNEKKNETFDPKPLMEAWLKTATSFWGPVLDMWSDTAETPEASRKKEAHRTMTNLESALKSWKAMSSAMSDPEAGKSILEGIQTLPEIVSKMTQTGWDGYLKLQQQWYERLLGIGQSTEAYRFDNLDQDAVNVWREIYEKEVQRLLHMPQLGLTRFYQERANKALDNFNLFQAAIAEFLQVLYLPMEKSIQVLQEKVAELADEGQLPENPKEYYQIWIKILEGHYMNLLKSPEYTKKMDRTLGAFDNFVASKNEILQDFLQTLPVPTDKDMDELYREIYLLKKRMREHEKTHELETSHQEPQI